MAEDVTTTGQESEGNDSGANAQDAGAKTFGEDYVKGLRAEAANWRTKAQAAEAKIKGFEDAQLTETEKLKADATQAKADAEAAKAAARQALAKAAIAEAASKAGVDVGLASRLVDVQFDDNGQPAGVDDAINKLIADHPNLRAGNFGGNAANAGRQQGLTVEAIKKMSPEQILERRDEVHRVLSGQ